MIWKIKAWENTISSWISQPFYHAFVLETPALVFNSWWDLEDIPEPFDNTGMRNNIGQRFEMFCFDSSLLLIKFGIGGIAWGICLCARAGTWPSVLPDKRCNKFSQYILNTHVAHCHYFRNDLQSKRLSLKCCYIIWVPFQDKSIPVSQHILISLQVGLKIPGMWR